jgi:hypothetical protein
MLFKVMAGTSIIALLPAAFTKTFCSLVVSAKGSVSAVTVFVPA